MTQLGQMLVDWGIEQGLEQGLEKGIEQGIQKGAKQNPVYFDGIYQRIKMGFGIIVQINGANLQGVYRGFGEGRVSQHIHLIFEALAGELAHMGKQIPGNSPETGLGIGHGYAVQKPEQGAGQKIAETAAEGNIILMEIAAAKQEKAILLPVKLLHLLIHPPDIRCQMLAVGVGGNDAQSRPLRLL